MLEVFDFRDSSDTLGYLWGLVFEYQTIAYLDIEKNENCDFVFMFDQDSGVSWYG